MWRYVLMMFMAGFAGADEPLFPEVPKRLAEGFVFSEGPVWHPTEGLLFSDVQADTIYRADKTVFRKPSGRANGLAFAREQGVIACQQGERRVALFLRDGSTKVLAERFEDKRLNAPNDITMRSDGVIFFTDPMYGTEAEKQELGFQGVFAIMPDGALKLLTKELEFPNGIALSPDEKKLYVGDSGNNYIQVYTVAADTSLSGGSRFCAVQTPDGMKMDTQGRLWVAAADGVHVYMQDGKEAGVAHMPETPATNCAFGGADSRTLYVTTVKSVFQFRVNAAGIQHSWSKHPK